MDKPSNDWGGQAARLTPFQQWTINFLKRHTRFVPFYRHRHFTPFLLLAYPNSGGGWVNRALNSHPHVLTIGDALTPFVTEDKDIESLTYFFERPHGRQVQALGSLMFYQQVYTDTGLAFWKHWLATGWPVLHVQRRNLLRLAVAEMMIQAGKEAAGGKQASIHKAKAIEILPEVLLQRMGHIEHVQQVFSSRLKDHSKVLSIYYEEMQQAPIEQFGRMERFLDVAPYPLAEAYSKQRPRSLTSMLLNYSEIRQELIGSKWEHFLEEPSGA